MLQHAKKPPTVIIVTPSRDSDCRAYFARGQLFDGYVGERLVVSGSTQPMVDACRILASEGVDPVRSKN